MVLVDGTYSKNLPVIIGLAKRLGAKIPPEVSDLVLNLPKLVCKVPEKKLEYKVGLLFCFLVLNGKLQFCNHTSFFFR